MTVFRHSCDGPDGAAVTTTGAPAGSDNWYHVVHEGDYVLAYDSSRFASGSSSIHCRAVRGMFGDGHALVEYHATAARNVKAGANIFIPAASETEHLIRAYYSSYGYALSLAGGKLRIRDERQGAVATASVAIARDTWNWIEYQAAGSAVQVEVFRGGVPIPDESVSLTVDSLGQLEYISFGVRSAIQDRVAECWLDDVCAVFGDGELVRPEFPVASADTLVYNGSAFVPGEVLTWDGAAFVPAAAVKTWDGQQWGPA